MRYFKDSVSSTGSYKRGPVSSRITRVEHLVHSNAREATLSVFPFVYLSSFDRVFLHESPIERIRWVSAEEIIYPLERRLAEAVIDDKSREKCLHFILRDGEGPLKYI